MVDIQTFVEESLQYTFDDILDHSPVKEEHREEIENVFRFHLMQHINSTPRWVLNYIAKVDPLIKKHEGLTWIDELMYEVFFGPYMDVPAHLLHDYHILNGEIMTRDRMMYEMELRRKRDKRISEIQKSEVDSIIKYVTEHEGPVYINTIMHHFGESDHEERDAYRSVVWGLISDKALTLENNLSLTVEKSLNV